MSDTQPDKPSRTERDTARARSRTFKSGGESRNAATQRDTERAAERVTRSADYADRIEARNAAAMSVPDEPLPNYGHGTEEFVSANTPYFGGGSGTAVPGIEIIWADNTSTYIRVEDLFAGYDPAVHSYWSMVVPVALGVSDPTSITYDSTEALFEDDGGTPAEQTKFRFRLITQGLDANGDPANVALSAYGQYREMTIVIDGELYQTLIKAT